MSDWLMAQGMILYVFAGCLAVGVISAWIANRGFKRLIRESEFMGTTQNRLLKYIKLKFGSYYKLNMRPRDTQALIRHYMYKYKIGFMNVLSWIRLSKLAAGAAGIAAVIRLLYMLALGSSVQQMLSMGGCGLLCVGLIGLANRLYDFPEKRSMVEWYLMDYLENFLKNKLESAGGRSAATEIHGERTADGASETGKDHWKNASEKGIAWNEKGHNHNEAAASRVRSLDFKRPDPAEFSENAAHEAEDDMDARIVEDILKEFLV